VVSFAQERGNTQGTPISLRVTSKLDGSEDPQFTLGAKSVWMIAQKLVDPYTVEFTTKTDEKVTSR
jgi:hypothetical protein